LDGLSIEEVHCGHDAILELCLVATPMWRSTERATLEKKTLDEVEP
jgi:hypothetical protein